MYRSHRRFKTNPEIDENCHFGSPWRTGRVPWTSSTLPPYYSYRAGSNKLYDSLVTFFQPRNGPGSLWDWIFTQNDNFIKDATARNKNYQNFNLLTLNATSLSFAWTRDPSRIADFSLQFRVPGSMSLMNVQISQTFQNKSWNWWKLSFWEPLAHRAGTLN